MTLRVRSGPLWLLVVLVIAVVAAAFAAPAIAAQSVPEVTPPDATYSYDLDTSSTTPSATLALDGLRVYGSSAPRSRSRTSSIALSRAAEEGSSAIEQAASKVPDEWGPGQPARSGGGWRWIPNKGDYVRVDPGNPDSADPLQQVDHVHVTSNGQVVADHLPLSEWLQWGSWNQP
jgi:hypothetical protein